MLRMIATSREMLCFCRIRVEWEVSGDIAS